MNQKSRLSQIYTDLAELCIKIDNRHVGGCGNRKAADYIAGRMSAAGFQVAQPEFDCIDWEYGKIILKVVPWGPVFSTSIVPL